MYTNMPVCKIVSFAIVLYLPIIEIYTHYFDYTNLEK